MFVDPKQPEILPQKHITMEFYTALSNKKKLTSLNENIMQAIYCYGNISKLVLFKLLLLFNVLFFLLRK